MLTKIHADYAVSISELKKQMPLRLASMSYKLKFLPSALKEWRKPAPEIDNT